MDRQANLPDPMRLLGHFPFRIHCQSFRGYSMARAESSDKIGDATRERSDKKIHGARARVGAAVFDRLVGDNSMIAGRDIEPAAAMMNNGEGHMSNNAIFNR